MLDEFDGEGAVLQRFEKAGAGRAIAFPLGIDNGVLQVQVLALGGQLAAGATDGNHHVVERAGACVAAVALENRQLVR